MKKIIFSLLLVLGAINTANAVEGDAQAGKDKSSVCGACHGATGINPNPTYPDLAGQHAAYITKQLADFKSGARSDMMMAPMAANLSEQDMADLAAYFASQKRASERTEAADDNSAPTTAAATTGSAEIVTSTPAKAIYAGDVKAGQEKSAMCVACHGADGNSLVAIYPKLAGQSASYLTKQLADFKSGARKDPVMVGMVAALSEKDMQDLGAFFAVQTPTAGVGTASNVGQKLYFGGDAEKGITACVACHGVNGKGMAQAGFPALAGQNAAYLNKQIASFRDGSRGNDRNDMMRNIAIKLSDNDIDELVKYMSSLK
ncbi:cytochrome c4 [Colwellia sp. 39_35_sub15_T18]|nr:cytochrome c4 [Colwellia sp. 39_35_sub15_T18]